MDTLDKIALLVGGKDNVNMEQLQIIVEITEQKLLTYIQKSLDDIDTSDLKKIPSELNYILVETSIIRFNQLGNEGMKSINQDGLGISFDENLFDKYLDDILSWGNQSRLGCIKFL